MRVVELVALRRISLSDGDVGNDAGYDVVPFFDRIPLGVFQRVTFGDDPARVQTKRRHGRLKETMDSEISVLRHLRHLRTTR